MVKTIDSKGMGMDQSTTTGAQGNIGREGKGNGDGSYDEQVERWVLQYVADKFAPTPISMAMEGVTDGKAPRLTDWDTTRIDNPNIWLPGENIGLVLGAIGYKTKGRHLVTVDLDNAIAVKYGARFLPETRMISGRSKKPRSNLFYLIAESKTTPSLTRFESTGGGVIVEILGPHRQVVVPPSIVIGKSGGRDQKSWDEYGAPEFVEYSDLVAGAQKIAVFSELWEIWPRSGRHNLALPLSGGLLRGGWSVEDTIWAIDTLGWETQKKGDRELERIVEGTAEKIARDEGATGWPTFEKTLLERAGEGGSEEEKGKIKSGIGRILGWIKPDFDDKPGVEVRPGSLDKIVTRAWKILGDTNTPVKLMRFSNEPVRIEKVDDRETYIITPLTNDRLRYHVSEKMSWYRKGSDDKRKPMDPPKDLIAAMLAAGDVPLPILSRIVTAPVFSSSGELQTSAGYHPESRTYYIPLKGVDIDPIPLDPSEGEVGGARELLLSELLVDFPFDKQSDVAHAVAYILLPFVRDIIDGPTPLHIIDANTQGSGKTLLAEVGSGIFCGGNGAAPMTFPVQEEEMAKILLAMLSEGRSHGYFDNVTAKMSSASLAMALTGSYFAGRRLGVTETLRPPVRCVWVATSNQAHGDTDVIRRSIQIRIVSREEHPHLIPIDRWKHYPLREWAKENRGRLIWACLTLCQNWISKGMVSTRSSFGDFGSWAGVMGGILSVNGIGGFLENVIDFQTFSNLEKEAWMTFYDDAWSRYGNRVWAASDVVGLAQNAGIQLRGRDHDDFKRELGAQLMMKNEVIHNGLRLTTTGEPARRGSGKGWQLESVDGRTSSGIDNDAGHVGGDVDQSESGKDGGKLIVLDWNRGTG